MNLLDTLFNLFPLLPILRDPVRNLLAEHYVCHWYLPTIVILDPNDCTICHVGMFKDMPFQFGGCDLVSLYFEYFLQVRDGARVRRTRERRKTNLYSVSYKDIIVFIEDNFVPCSYPAIYKRFFRPGSLG